MPDHQGRQDFPEVADEKIHIGSFNEWAPLGVSDIYSPKEEPKLRDQVMLDQAAMLKEICTLIESFGKKPAAKKVEDPFKGTSIKKGFKPGSPEAKKQVKEQGPFKPGDPLTAPAPVSKSHHCEDCGEKLEKGKCESCNGSSIEKATGWTMDKQNPQNWGEDAYYQPPSAKELKSGHATMSGEKSEVRKNDDEKEALEKAIVKSINNYLV